MLSVEIFSILFTFGVVKSVVVLLFVDTAIFIGLLVVGMVKMDYDTYNRTNKNPVFIN